MTILGLSGSDVQFPGNGERVLHLDSEVSDRILDLGMAKKQLDRTQIAGPAVYQDGPCAAQRMRSVTQRIEPNGGDPA